MKKIISTALIFIAAISISQAQLKVGITAGANRSTQRINVSSGGTMFSNSHFQNYHAGLISEVRIANNFYVQPELLYIRKGSTIQSSIETADRTIRLNYVSLPVTFLYKLPLPFGSVFAGAGATFSYGFGGSELQNGTKTKLYGAGKPWKHEDLSLNMKAGIEFDNGLFASISSQKGLLDVYKGSNASVKNRSISLSVGYIINWNAFKKKS